jgi:hypothetical protein
MAGGSSRWAFSNEPQFGTQMPGAGAVHPIRSAPIRNFEQSIFSLAKGLNVILKSF